MLTEKNITVMTVGVAVGVVVVNIVFPDAAWAQAADRVQGRLLSVGGDVARVARNVIWGGAVIAAIVAIGAMVMGKIDVKRFITIGVACVLLGVVGGVVSVFTTGGEGGNGVDLEGFDDSGSINDSFGGN